MKGLLTKDSDKVLVIKDKTKYLMNRILTTIVEILEGMPIDEMSDKRRAELNEHRQYKDKPFSTCDKKTGMQVMDCTDSFSILITFYYNKKNTGDYKKHIADICKDNADFPDFQEREFNKDYDKHCREELKILDLLRDDRNDYAHDPCEGDDVYYAVMWLQQLIMYIQTFIVYRTDTLAKYDSDCIKESDIKKLSQYKDEASNLKAQCYDNADNHREFRFGKEIYTISDEDDEDDDKCGFESLVTALAKEWENGIRAIRRQRICEEFRKMLEIYNEDYNVVVEFEEIYEEFSNTEKGSIEESIKYMSLLYLAYPGLNGIYWKGKMYTESYFASMVLQMLIRHTGRNGIEEKKKELVRRINKSAENWNEENKRGIGIDVVGLCKGMVLSRYFEGHKDKEGIVLAKNFEKSILCCGTIDIETMPEYLKTVDSSSGTSYKGREYDKIIRDILALTAHMKGSVTYILPLILDGEEKPRVFKDFKEFQVLFANEILKNEEVSKICKFIDVVEEDNNYKWFRENSGEIQIYEIEE